MMGQPMCKVNVKAGVLPTTTTMRTTAMTTTTGGSAKIPDGVQDSPP